MDGRTHPSLLLFALFLLACLQPAIVAMRPARMAELRQQTIDMFYHGYDNYMHLAFPEDEVRVMHRCTSPPARFALRHMVQKN